MFGKVDYCIDENSYSRKMHDVTQKLMSNFIGSILESLLSKEKKNAIFDNDFDIVHYEGYTGTFSKTPSFDFIYFVKRHFFNVESEFRLVIQVPRIKLDELKEEGLYKFRVSNGLMVPYLDIKFGVEALRGINLSPTVNSDLAEKSIMDYCNYCGISNLTNDIAKSAIPVRF